MSEFLYKSFAKPVVSRVAPTCQDIASSSGHALLESTSNLLRQCFTTWILWAVPHAAADGAYLGTVLVRARWRRVVARPLAVSSLVSTSYGVCGACESDTVLVGSDVRVCREAAAARVCGAKPKVSVTGPL